MSELIAALRPLLAPRAGMARVLERPNWFLALAVLVLASGVCYSVYLVRASPDFLLEHEIARQEQGFLFTLVPEDQRFERQAELRDYLRDTPPIVSHLDGWTRLTLEWVIVLQVLTLLLAGLFWFRGDRLIPLRRAFINLGVSAGLLATLAVWLTLLWFLFGAQKIYFSVAAAFSTAAVLVLWLNRMFRLADDPDYRAYLGMVSHGLLVFVPFQLIGIVIAASVPGLRVPFEQLVPRSFGSLLFGPDAGGRVAGVLGAADLAWFWFWLLAAVGVSERTGRPLRDVVLIALAPWLAWVAVKLLWALIAG